MHGDRFGGTASATSQSAHFPKTARSENSLDISASYREAPVSPAVPPVSAEI